MRAKVEAILKSVLPKNAYILVADRKSIFGDAELKIMFAARDFDINGVSGQKPQIVSLMLTLKNLDLHVQIFGGNGGQCIYRKPNLNDAKEKYLAMKSVKIPFRRPLPSEENVLAAIKRFAENWLKALKENQNELMYQQYVDYNSLLNS